MREAQLKLQKTQCFLPYTIQAFLRIASLCFNTAAGGVSVCFVQNRLVGQSRTDTAVLLSSSQQIFFLIVEEQWLGLIERGNCLFNDKAHNVVNKHKSSGFILYNSNDPEAKNSIMNISGESIKAKRSSASSHFIAVS